MKFLVIDNNSKHIAKLCALFNNADSMRIEEFSLEKACDYYDAIVLSGGSNVQSILRHPSVYQDQFDLVHAWNKPMIGVCLGAEIIVSALGGELEEMEFRHKGQVIVSVIDEQLVDTIGTNHFIATEAHQVRVKHLPVDFEALAVSDHGIEIFQHKTLPIIGFQFHPELTNNDRLKDWIEFRFT